MVNLSLLLMEMQKPNNNAFTILEMMIVLLIVSISTIGIQAHSYQPSLSIFMKKMMSYSIILQEQAFIEKEQKQVTIENSQAYFDSTLLTYPTVISCEAQSFHYNEKGNISKANTITCYRGNETMSLIYQLGTGRVRIEKR